VKGLPDALAELELAGHPDRSRAVLDWYLEGLAEPLPGRPAAR
jgi:hypothetical protein